MSELAMHNYSPNLRNLDLTDANRTLALTVEGSLCDQEFEEQNDDWILTLTDSDILQLQSQLSKARQQLYEIIERWRELEIPDVFTLHPLSTRRMTGNVVKTKVAKFSFVENDEQEFDEI